MDIDEKLICRICLQISKNDFEILNEAIHELLNLLALRLNLAVSPEYMVCNMCMANIEKYVAFKTACLQKRNPTVVNCKDVLSTPKICVTETIATNFNNTDICCFCMQPTAGKSTSLSTEEMNVTTLKKYLPEIVNEFDNGMNLMVCIPCYETLQDYLGFITKCMTVEEKIKEYCRVEGTDNKGQIQLSNVIYFLSKNQLQDNLNNFSPTNTEVDCEWQDNDKFKIKSEDLEETEGQELHWVKNEEIKLESETDDDGFDVLQNDTESSSDMLTHKSLSELPIYKCDICGHQTKRKSGLRVHLLTHRNLSEITTYKCEICTFETKYKNSLRVHALIHVSTSEVPLYKCEMCTYQTKHKANIRIHMLAHKSTSEVTMYSCDICTFRAKHKNSLQRHKRTHKSKWEVPMYSCKKCTYETKHKDGLQHHMLTHKNTSELTMHKCEMCRFQTKFKRSLDRHILNHKKKLQAQASPDKGVTAYTCEKCTFETQEEDLLRKHTLIHKSTPEIVMFKCEVCDYESNMKYNLRRHMLVHKSGSEITVFKCENCKFQTKHKNCLLRHMSTHEKCL